MKKIIFALLSFCLVISFQACSEDSTSDTEKWREKSVKAYDEKHALASDSLNTEWNFVKLPGLPDAIIYRELEKNESGETDKPIQYSTVKVFYKGTLFDGTVFDYGTKDSDVPYSFSVANVIEGFACALQCMVKGDKWEVWIPWEYGYGEYKSGSIPAYSTLVFEIELVDFEKYPN